jgi:hypothetical protein
MGIQEAVTKFAAKVEDLSTLEVLTYTGKLEHAIDSKTGELDWNAFKPTSGVLTLAAATRISADYDTVNFRASDSPTAGADNVLALHKAAVESAQSGRVALLGLFRGLIDGAG